MTIETAVVVPWTSKDEQSIGIEAVWVTRLFHPES
jgi:hypothetical protein